MNVQLINDFYHIVNRETILALVEQGYDVESPEIWEILSDRVWANWQLRGGTKGKALLKCQGGAREVELTEDLRVALPGRLQNFKYILAEVLLVKHLKAINVNAWSAPVNEDFKGIDVYIEDNFGAIAKVAVLRDTPQSWSDYARKYPYPKCHYYFAFDNLESITKDSVIEWYCGNFF